MASASFDDRGLVVTCPVCSQKNRLVYDRLGDAVRCGNCKQALSVPSSPLEVTSVADFDRLIARSSLPIVVDYWAPWCGPCRMVAPELQKVATRRAGRAIVVKVNTDQLAELGERYAIRSIPTLAVFVDGREAARTVGVRPADEIDRLIDQAVASASRAV